MVESSAPQLSKRHGGRPTLKQAEQITSRIVDTASELFLSNGFNKTSIDEIAAATRISKRTFYTRFASKQDLFVAVIEKIVEFHLKPIKSSRHRKGSLESSLVSVSAELSKLVFHPQIIALGRMVIAESREFPELSRAMNDPGGKLTISAIEGIFLDALARGEIGDSDTRFLTQQFINMMIAGPWMRVVLGTEPRRTGKPLRDHLVRSVRIFLFGCARPKTA